VIKVGGSALVKAQGFIVGTRLRAILEHERKALLEDVLGCSRHLTCARNGRANLCLSV
jgi:hypothetical protein